MQPAINRVIRAQFYNGPWDRSTLSKNKLNIKINEGKAEKQKHFSM